MITIKMMTDDKVTRVSGDIVIDVQIDVDIGIGIGIDMT